MAERFDRRAFLARVLYGATAAWIAPSLNSLPVGAVERLALPGAAAPRTILGKADGSYCWWTRTVHCVEPEGLVLSAAGHRYHEIDTEALHIAPGSYCLRYRLVTGYSTVRGRPCPVPAHQVVVGAAGQGRVLTNPGARGESEDFALGFTVAEPADLVIAFRQLEPQDEDCWVFIKDVTLERTSASALGPPPACEPLPGGRPLLANTPLDRHRDEGVLLRRPERGACVLISRTRVETREPETPRPEHFDARWRLTIEAGTYRFGYRLAGYHHYELPSVRQVDPEPAEVTAVAGDHERSHLVDYESAYEDHSIRFDVPAPSVVPLRVELADPFHNVFLDEVTLRRLH